MTIKNRRAEESDSSKNMATKKGRGNNDYWRRNRAEELVYTGD